MSLVLTYESRTIALIFTIHFVALVVMIVIVIMIAEMPTDKSPSVIQHRVGSNTIPISFSAVGKIEQRFRYDWLWWVKYGIGNVRGETGANTTLRQGADRPIGVDR